MNLTINVRDAMPKGGTINVDGQNYDGDRDPLAASDDGNYHLRRRSAAASPEMLDKGHHRPIHDQGRGKGTGLGLSMVYGFAKQSGGTLCTSTATSGKGRCLRQPTAPDIWRSRSRAAIRPGTCSGRTTSVDAATAPRTGSTRPCHAPAQSRRDPWSIRVDVRAAVRARMRAHSPGKPSALRAAGHRLCDAAAKRHR